MGLGRSYRTFVKAWNAGLHRSVRAVIGYLGFAKQEVNIMLRCLVVIVATSLFGMSANALTVQECRQQYKADMDIPIGGSHDLG